MHILSGKVIVHALRVLYLHDARINTKLLELVIPACIIHHEQYDDDDSDINENLSLI